MVKEYCCISGCKNIAKQYLGNNLNKGSIPFCDECFRLYDQHLEARENMFKVAHEKDLKDKQAKLLEKLYKFTILGSPKNNNEFLIVRDIIYKVFGVALSNIKTKEAKK